MTIASVMVPVELESGGAERLLLARSLAERFASRLIGIAACEPLPIRHYGRGAYINARIAEEGELRASKQLMEAEALFRAHTCGMTRAEWRISRGALTPFLAEQARAADLIVLGRWRLGPATIGSDTVDPGEMILRLGRPVLVVPPDIRTLHSARIMIAWKDTREARRAVHDSLPFLAMADRVCIASVAPEASRDGADDLADYLAQHGIADTEIRRTQAGPGVADVLLRLARDAAADLIVAGAYGHSRLRERVFGSVTEKLLVATPACTLMSH
ncbi:universal stress protein [Methylobacterium oryzisoli]|uniref:universal stress protein n=1 Tax=Methylobacterium oryzisoli TaxID=3385502 RepID=UPI0038920D9D